MSMVDYMGLKLRHVDSTDTGGSSYLLHVGHAAEAIAAGKCKVALITLAGRPRAEGMATGTVPRSRGGTPTPDEPFEFPYGPTVVNMYAMCAMRHMHEFGTTAEQLAWIKVAASHHAQHNPHALLRDVVTVEEVVNSPMISDPLHRLDCCVITDGGGAIVVVAPEIAAKLKRPMVKLIGAGEAAKNQMGGKVDLTYSGARFRARRPSPRRASSPPTSSTSSIYDSFTITVLMQLEDLGFCEKGEGGKLRRRRQPDLGHRQAAVQHRRRRAVQQPSRQPRRHDQGDRGGAPAARRGASQGAGEELRSRAGARHRRLARPAPRQRHPHPGEGVDHGREPKSARCRRRPSARRPRPIGTPPPRASCWCANARAAARLHHYPRAICPFCFSDKTEWIEASGKGTIYSYSVMRRAPVPYAIAYVTLDEGLTMMTNIVDCDLDKLKCGQAVKVVFKPTDGGPPVPMFTPA